MYIRFGLRVAVLRRQLPSQHVTSGEGPRFMSGRLLVFLAFAQFLQVCEGDSEGLERGCLASSTALQTSGCTDLFGSSHKRFFWKVVNEEIADSSESLGKTSRLQFLGTAGTDTELPQYDLVLPNMPDEQWATIHLLSPMSSSLVRGVADAQRTFEIQKQEGEIIETKSFDQRRG